MDFADFVPLFMPFSLAGVVTNNSMALYFVGEKHQRRRSFCLHHGLIGWSDFADFWVCVPSANVGANSASGETSAIRPYICKSLSGYYVVSGVSAGSSINPADNPYLEIFCVFGQV